ncbi:MAG: ketopantoate reductase family protein [Candidatus Omnitrophota bacterium]
MKIMIVGPGAMGCLFGAFFLRAGEEVFFLDKNKKRAEELVRRGIKVEGLTNFIIKDIKATVEAEEIKKVDLVILTTKAYSTESAVKNIIPILDRQTFVLTLQNGLGNIETIARYVSPQQIIAGVTAEGATLIDTGYIRHAGRGETIIGALPNAEIPLARIKEIIRTFQKAGFKSRFTQDVEGLIWSKVIINVGINALAAITGLNNGRLLEFPYTLRIMEEAVREAQKVAEKKKIRLIYADPVKKVKEVCKKTYSNISSMLQDILRKKKTEVDYINGAIVREGEKLKLSTPVNALLTDLIKTIESSYHLKVN